MSRLAGVPAISNGGYLDTVRWGKARRAKGGKAQGLLVTLPFNWISKASAVLQKC